MTRAAIYRRISNDPTGRQAGVDRQETESRELAKARGWDVVEVYTDNDISAASGKVRPAWRKLLADLTAGTVDAVVAWHPDRLYRRPADLEELIQLIETRAVRIGTVSAGDVDLSTPAGVAVARTLVAWSKYEVDQSSARQKARWAQRKRDGKNSTLGRRPFGFSRVGEAGEKRLVVNRSETKLIREAATRIVAGSSLYAVSMDWRSQSVTTPYGNAWRPQHLRRMLVNRLLVEHGILTEDQHALLVARLGAMPVAPRGRPPGRRYVLGGLVVCGLCGSKLAGSSGSYHCTASSGGCGRVGVKAAILEQYVVGEVVGHAPAADAPASPEDGEDPAPLLEELRKIEERLAALADNVDLSEAMLNRRARALETRKAELNERLGRSGSRAISPRVDFTDLDPERWNARKLEESEVTGLHDLVEHFVDRITVGPRVLGNGRAFNPARVSISWR